MRHRLRRALCWLPVLLWVSSAGAAPLVVGSKTFTESHVLAELAAQTLEQAGFEVERRQGLGGTMVLWEALQGGDVDVYPEYSGTLAQTILQRPDADEIALAAALAERDLAVVAELGFNNSYAIAVDARLAQSLGLRAISDLREHPELSLGFSLEFLNRADGWPSLKAHYDLPHEVTGLEHALAYRAIAGGSLAATDAYTTDGDLEDFDLVLLEDDRSFFPRYDAMLIGRGDLPDAARAALATLVGTLDEPTIRALNAGAGEPGVSPRQVVADYLGRADSGEPGIAGSILRNTLRHLKLTGIALLLACALALPLALYLSRFRRAAAAGVYLAGLLQTIPSLALLAMLVPLLGLGETPAILALFLYSLLPIIRNTLAGIASVDPLLVDVADGMGMTASQKLRHVELPLATPMILAGVKTAAIISIGTATLAAFVGAGGLGEPIVAGLNLNDPVLILQGAIPAAVLAIVTEFLFECVERVVLPEHLVRRI
ncbi:MAG: glycine betaine ABC transporter substrate-binding protein [Halieaceae bacterium]|jgi:osmoprotectant transport system permease protein|nr:glycine betaine ABC transporter substrate-binding protein [Halieaceae bacterium]